MHLNQMVDVKKASEMTGLSISWWRKAIQRRSVPFCKIGRRVLLEQADIAKLLSVGRIEPLPNTACQEVEVNSSSSSTVNSPERVNRISAARKASR